MPYYITDEAEGCDGWATVKDDGEVMGCHATKQEAIDQGVAIAISEDSEFLGERVAPDAVGVGDFVSWNSSGGRARGRIVEIVRDGRLPVPGTDFVLNATEDDPAALIDVYRPVRDGWEASGTLVVTVSALLLRLSLCLHRRRKRTATCLTPTVLRPLRMCRRAVRVAIARSSMSRMLRRMVVRAAAVGMSMWMAGSTVMLGSRVRWRTGKLT